MRRGPWVRLPVHATGRNDRVTDRQSIAEVGCNESPGPEVELCGCRGAAAAAGTVKQTGFRGGGIGRQIGCIAVSIRKNLDPARRTNDMEGGEQVLFRRRAVRGCCLGRLRQPDGKDKNL